MKENGVTPSPLLFPSDRIIALVSPAKDSGTALYRTPIPSAVPETLRRDLRSMGFFMSAPFLISSPLRTRLGEKKFPRKIFSEERNKNAFWWFSLKCVSEAPQFESFEALAVPLFDQLYNFAHWLAQNRAEAEDLVQETYAKALRGFSSFQPGTNFRAWMYRILRNTFLTSRAGLKATVPIEDEEEPAASPEETPESLFIASANRALVQSAIEDLPVRFREIILL